jgi:SAM-dependent methyltransferase
MVLDAGCGSGYPVTQRLAASFQVTGLDFAKEQLRRIRNRVPKASIVCGDLTNLPFQASSFDAVVSYYAIIHVPRQEHREIVLNIHRILRPGGLTLLCMGAGDLPSDTGAWFGTKMFWSHYDTDTNLRILRDSRFTILTSETVDDPISPGPIHLFILAQKDDK